MVAFAGYPRRGEKAAFSSPSRRYSKMSSRTGNLMIAVGALALIMGLIALPAALGEHVETSLLTLGACGISIGSMIIAAGVYLKSRLVLTQNGSKPFAGESKQSSSRRVRGGCDVCHGDLPVIHCKVHQVHLCADCLARHYDFRSCTYVPSPRGASAKNAKAMAKSQSS